MKKINLNQDSLPFRPLPQVYGIHFVERNQIFFHYEIVLKLKSFFVGKKKKKNYFSSRSSIPLAA